MCKYFLAYIWPLDNIHNIQSYSITYLLNILINIGSSEKLWGECRLHICSIYSCQGGKHEYHTGNDQSLDSIDSIHTQKDILIRNYILA